MANRSIIALSFLLLAGPARAETLSWEQSLREAEAKNPSLRAAYQNLSSAEYDERGAHAGYFPSVSGQLSYGRSQGAADQYGASLNASQNIFNGLADQSRVEQASAAVVRARAALVAAKASLSSDLKTAFAEMRYAQDYRTLAEQIVTRRQDNLSLVSLRFDNGSENKGSVLLSRANLEQAKLEALQAQNALEVARTQLARVLGRDEGEAFGVAGDVPVAAPVRAGNFRELALKTPTAIQSEAAEKSAAAGVALARSTFFPTLNVTGSTGRVGETFFPEESRWSLGVSLSVPIFSGGSSYYATKSAARQEEAASLAKQNTFREENRKLASAFAGYEQAAQKLEVDKSFAEAALTRANIGRARYNNGLLTFENWDVIENDLISRQKSLLQSQRDRVTSEAAWEATQGKGVIQ